MGGEHFEGGEGEDSGQTIVQKSQFGEKVGKKEVEGAETHDGHDVGGVGQEGVAGDGENGGDGVEREDDIGEFNGKQGQEENGDHAAAIFADEKMILAEADGVDAGDPFDPAGRRLGLLGGGQDKADGGDEQNGGEDVADPLEVGQQLQAGGDEAPAHENGARNSPEEDLGLTVGLDVEGAKEDEEDEEVVDGKRLFDGIAGKVLGCGLAAHGEEEEEGHGEGCGNPEDCGGDGGGMGFCRALTANVEELHPQEDKDEEVKTYPVADGSGAGHLCWMLQGRGTGCTDWGGSGVVRKEDVGGLCLGKLPAARAHSGGRLFLPCDDHGVDPVEGHREHQPHNGREEEATHDLAYGVGVEETAVG